MRPSGSRRSGGSLGVSRRSVLWRVTLPLVAPGLVAAFALVFLETATELTATLVLHPTNVETLATQFWAYQSNVSYSQAAPMPASWCSSPPCPATCSVAGSTASPRVWRPQGQSALDAPSTMVSA